MSDTDECCFISFFAPILKLLVQIYLKFSVKYLKKKKNRLSLSLGDAIVDTNRYIKLTKYIEIYTINDLVDAPSQIMPLV